MGDDRAESYQCNQCGGFWEDTSGDSEGGSGTAVEATGTAVATPTAAVETTTGEVACQQCGSTEVAPFDPRATPYAHQPNPELLHLQYLTPRPPVVPGAMVTMGPYMPLPRPTSPPARWAEDPTGRNQWRWWGGSRWTDHVANDGVATTDPLD